MSAYPLSAQIARIEGRIAKVQARIDAVTVRGDTSDRNPLAVYMMHGLTDGLREWLTDLLCEREDLLRLQRMEDERAA